MQQQRSPAVRYGLRFGLFIGLVVIIQNGLNFATGGLSSLANTFTSTPGTNVPSRATTSPLLGLVFIVIYLGLYFWAGMSAARQTGKAGTGALAAMIASLIGGLVSLVLGIIVIFSLPASLLHSIVDQVNSQAGARSHLTVHQLQTALHIVGTITLLLLYVVEMGIAAGVGAIGGLAGKSRAPLPTQMYQDSLYRGPMQPGYPPQQPGYPPQQPGYPPQQPGYPPAQGYPPAGTYPPPPPGNQTPQP